MKLTIARNQSKGMLGGVSFEVRAQVQLNQEEDKLVKHYNLENEVLMQKHMVNIWGQPTDHKLDIRLNQLLRGEGMKCKDLGEVLAYSDAVKAACETLKTYLEVARSFGGQEVVEI